MATSSVRLNSFISSDKDAIVTLRGGVVVELAVLKVLWSLEDRGAKFLLKSDGGFRVEPAALLTAAETQFLRQHRNEARRVLEYTCPEVCQCA
jgi:hypothetical protein